MTDVEVYIDLDGTSRHVGLLRRHTSRREETVTFEYDETWLADDERFSCSGWSVDRPIGKAGVSGRLVNLIICWAWQMKHAWVRCDCAGAEKMNSRRLCLPVFPQSSNWDGCCRSPNVSCGTKKPMRICNSSSRLGRRSVAHVPRASVIDQHGHLSIAKFPKETDDYSIETWEEIALRLAERAGISTPRHELLNVAGKPVLLSRRFDRTGNT